MRLRIASYNVHRCIGTDRKHNPQRVAEVLRELDADIVGLQEVSSRFVGDTAIDQLDYLASAAGMKATAGPLCHHETGHFGNALLSRSGVKTFWLHDLSFRRREPRGAIEALVAVDGIDFRVVVTHFGLFGRERMEQARALKRVVSASEPLPTILLGDFNEWVPRARTLLFLDGWLGPSVGVRTFPSRLPLLAMDRIWVESPHCLERVWAHRSRLAAAASDHLPLIAEVCLYRR